MLPSDLRKINCQLLVYLEHGHTLVSLLWCPSACQFSAARRCTSLNLALRLTRSIIVICCIRNCCQKSENYPAMSFLLFSRTAHRARDTILLLEQETPDFIPPTLWPPNSPDLNPVDYTIWDILQQRVYRKAITSVQQLRERIAEEWDKFDHALIVSSIQQWRRRLKLCVAAKGGHFEHHL